MKNKQHELILRAFLESKIPEVIKQDQPAFILIDSALGGYCTRVLRGDKLINMHQVITTEDKKVFSDLINQNKDERKTELIIYYRLAVLTEEVLLQHQSNQGTVRVQSGD
ncbi:MAG: hypothetical protein IK108_06380 [Clostridia bacterium]|nr:hypothetical protein [Clostridia bacterium]